MARPIMSAFADEYSSRFDGQLEGLSSLGIKYLELRHADKTNVSKMDMEKIKELKAKLDKSGIAVSAVGSPLGKIKSDADMDAELARAEKIFGFANELESKYVRIFSLYKADGMNDEDYKSTVYSYLERMIKLASKYNVLLCHENEAKVYGETAEKCLEMLDYFGGDLGCVFDMGNFVLDGVAPYPYAYEMLKKYIAYFHIKDALAAGAIVPPGCGEARIADILKEHSEYAKNDFFVSLEPHLQTFSGLNALVGKSFDNPYKFPDKKTAFCEAAKRLSEIIG